MSKKLFDKAYTKELLSEVKRVMKQTKEELEHHKEAKASEEVIDLDPNMYNKNPKRCPRGSLLQLKQDVPDFYNIKTDNWARDINGAFFREGDGVFVTHSFEHRETGAILIVILSDDNMYMHHSSNFETEFEILRKGTV